MQWANRAIPMPSWTHKRGSSSVQVLRDVHLPAATFVLPGHPQTVVYMLAEWIADNIRSNRVPVADA